MSLKEQITADMKTAMRAREAVRLSTIRLLLAAIRQREIDERIELDDAAVLTVIEKQIKQRRDSVEQYTKAGRAELAASETAEIDVLMAYLPVQASEAEVAAAVDAAIAQAGATGPGQMGAVMGLLKTQLGGKADMAKVSGVVRARLAGTA
ncbi:MAG: GatB/YqeY domain-containing protein [Burkholderiaceae bacterium]